MKLFEAFQVEIRIEIEVEIGIEEEKGIVISTFYTLNNMKG
jgi:hypothetical protein